MVFSTRRPAHNADSDDEDSIPEDFIEDPELGFSETIPVAVNHCYGGFGFKDGLYGEFLRKYPYAGCHGEDRIDYAREIYTFVEEHGGARACLDSLSEIHFQYVPRGLWDLRKEFQVFRYHEYDGIESFEIDSDGLYAELAHRLGRREISLEEFHELYSKFDDLLNLRNQPIEYLSEGYSEEDSEGEPEEDSEED